MKLHPFLFSKYLRNSYKPGATIAVTACFLRQASEMWPTSKRAQVILALSCCFIVLFAATAHLLHSHHSHHNHGKAVADLACSLCAYSAQATSPTVYILPQSQTLVDYSVVVHHERFESADLFSVQIGRAPPATA